MTLDECLDKAEQGFAAEEHGYRPSGISDMLENAGFSVYGSEGKSLQAVLWSTVTPESLRTQLFLSLDSATAEQVAKAGLDRFVALRDALFRKSARQPQLVDYVARLTQSLPFDAFALLREGKHDLLAFLGSQELKANHFGVEYRGVEVMSHNEAASLVADAPQGIWKFRQRISTGRKYFDKAITENWGRWSPPLKRDFIAMLNARPLSLAERLGPEAYLDAFPLALKSDDWREALAAELSRRGSNAYTEPRMQTVWENALDRFESPAAKQSAA